MITRPSALLALAVLITVGSAVLLVLDPRTVSPWLTLVAGLCLCVAQIQRLRQ